MPRFLGPFWALPLLCIGASAQNQPPAASAQNPAGEMTQHDEPATFQARVNLVMVPVVVRDRHGNAIGNLKKEDFQLFDRGKVQEITRFSIERPDAPAAEKNKDVATPESQSAPLDIPDRFVAYLFDDIHLTFGDLARARDAAWTHIQSLRSTDRAAIFTTSGQTMLEFTDDRDQLRATLMKLLPRPIAHTNGMQECPDLDYYTADLIVNKNDTMALQAATAEVIACQHLTGPAAQTAATIAQGAAQRWIGIGGQETRVALGVLRDLIRRVAGAPGQRTIILASPGFVTPEEHQEVSELLDRAVRANIVINSLDARGLWTDPSLDASRTVFSSTASRIRAQYMRDAALAGEDVLAEVAAGTGGSWFHNNNDLQRGFRELGDVPQYVYLLGFSPQNLKLNGEFHALKVSLAKTASAGMNISARKGYYAPKRLESAAETARQEIEDALFSREELREVPMELHTQFFKTGDTAKVAVLCHMDVRRLKFRKANDRNNDNVVVVSALFDRNGNLTQAIQKTIEFHLKDDTLENRLGPGVTLRTSFDVKPGTYLVRVVVRDTEGQMMAAGNGAVEIQ